MACKKPEFTTGALGTRPSNYRRINRLSGELFPIEVTDHPYFGDGSFTGVVHEKAPSPYPLFKDEVYVHMGIGVPAYRFAHYLVGTVRNLVTDPNKLVTGTSCLWDIETNIRYVWEVEAWVTSHNIPKLVINFDDADEGCVGFIVAREHVHHYINEESNPSVVKEAAWDKDIGEPYKMSYEDFQ